MRTFLLQPSAQAKPYTTRICKKKAQKKQKQNKKNNNKNNKETKQKQKKPTPH